MNRKFVHAVVALVAIGPVSANSVTIYDEIFFTPNTGLQSDVAPSPETFFVTANDFIPLIGGTISTVKAHQEQRRGGDNCHADPVPPHELLRPVESARRTRHDRLVP